MGAATGAIEDPSSSIADRPGEEARTTLPAERGRRMRLADTGSEGYKRDHKVEKQRGAIEARPRARETLPGQSPTGNRMSAYQPSSFLIATADELLRTLAGFSRDR